MLPVILFVASALAAPIEIVPGQQYNAGQQVGVAALGVAVTIPKGWTGGVPDGAEALMLGSMTLPGLLLVEARPNSTTQALAAEMSQPVPMDEGIVLMPVGSAVVAGDRVTGSYRGEGNGLVVVAHVGAVVGTNGTAVVVFAMGPETNAADYSAVLAKVLDKVVITAPKVAAPGSATGDFAQLKGRYLHYLHSTGAGVGGGYSDEKQVWLCSDGSFQSASASSALSLGSAVDLSSASQGGGSGTYNIAGSTISLTWTDGSVSNYGLAWVDSALHIDGERWFVRDNERCP